MPRQFPFTSAGARSPWANWWAGARAVLSRRGAAAGGARTMGLPAGELLRLHGVAGWTVLCRTGAVWITQEADARDIFLSAGDAFALDRGGLTLVCACHEAVLAIRPPGGRALKRDALPELPDAGRCPLPAGKGRLAWLRALYPESGPWRDPASYRRSGLL